MNAMDRRRHVNFARETLRSNFNESQEKEIHVLYLH